jgi:hypothetical protein
MLEKSKQYAESVRRVARGHQVPLVDYHAAILQRRPDDWDGSLPQFGDGNEYDVPTLVARDGVHPSNPIAHQDFSEQSLRSNGYALRNYLTALAYAEVIRHVLPARETREPALPVPRPEPEPLERGVATARQSRPAHFPYRIWAACDFEGQTPDYAWFGPTETTNIVRYAGNSTALSAFPGSGGTAAALKTGFNPVPGPVMGGINKLYLRYFLQGTSEAIFQHYSLSTNDNNHIKVTGLTEGKWSEVTLNFTDDARRNDGTPGIPFKEGERMDDFQLYLGQPNSHTDYRVLIDDVIFFAEDPGLPSEKEPFPKRVIFLAAFDTGIDAASKTKYWPGNLAIVTPGRGAPEGSYWGVARAVPRPAAKGKWIQLQIAPPRPVGVRTKLRVRYHLSGTSAMTVQIFDLTDNDNRHIHLRGLKQESWQTVYLDFTADAKRNDGSDTPFASGHKVDDLFFFIEPDGDHQPELFIDEVVLFDAVEPG